MAGERSINEQILRLSSKDLKKTQSCSMDFGGSVIKMVYTRQREDNCEIDLHLVSFARSDVSYALDYLKEKMLGVFNPGDVIDTCGIGCNQYKSQIRDTLGVEVRNQSELDCFVETFRFLSSNTPISELTHPPSEVAKKYADKMMEQFQLSMKIGKEKYETKHKDWELTQDPSTNVNNVDDGETDHTATEEVDSHTSDGNVMENGENGTSQEVCSAECKGHKAADVSTNIEYPCLLLMCGSAGSPLKIEADGTYQSMDILPLCGRSFLGLGCLLTGAKNFDELIQQSDRGNSDNLDVMGRDMKAEGEQDFYETIPDDMLAYCMGHTVGKTLDEVNKDDLASSWLTTVCFTTAQIYTLWALLLDIKNVYFCGSFSDNIKARNEISKFFLMRSMANPLGKFVSHYFLKHGAYLGCVGALMKNLNRVENKV